MKKSIWTVGTVAISMLALAPLASAQPSDTCTNANLGGGDTFPLSTFPPSATDDFTMTGVGCAEQGRDSVVCFSPTNSCVVTMTCGNDSGTQSANLYDAPCSTSPAACTATATGASAELTDVPLTGGVMVCFECEYSAAGGLPEMLITEQVTGACGALPVSLLGFTVE